MADAPTANPMSERGPGINRLMQLRHEWPLLVSVVTSVVFLIFSNYLLSDLSQLWWFGLILAWLFGVVLLAAFAVVRHADELAHRLGEPLGTLILTLSVTGIEVMMIAAVMYSAQGESTVARDAMFAVVMIVLNGMVGLSLLLGGLRYREQSYNLQGANAFMAVIVPLAVLGMVLPNFTLSQPGPSYSRLHATFLTIMSAGLYGAFLAIQNVRHREYFIFDTEDTPATPPSGANAQHSHGASLGYHIGFLVANLLPLVILSKKLAVPINHGIAVLNAPPALGGFLVAVLILSPESLSASRAAMKNQLQRSVNILLGSVLATIGLTIPAVLTIGFFTHRMIVLGLEPANMILLALTLGVSIMTFGAARTNVLLGIVHLLLFLAYVMMIFDR